MNLVRTDIERLKTSFISLLDEVRPSCLNGQDVAYLLKVHEEINFTINRLINEKNGEVYLTAKGEIHYV